MQATDKRYIEHPIFNNLKYYADFYENLSDSVMSFVTMGTSTFMNMDTYVFMSMKGTIESISLVLKEGKQNDAYALLRKYYDSVIINAYTNLYINDHREQEDYYITEINDWLRGKKPLPRMPKMIKYLDKSEGLVELHKLLNSDERYEGIRERCNDNMHYNYFSLLMMNEGKMYMKERLKNLEQLQQDLNNVFLLNIAYIFNINEHYMASSDYIDHLEMGLTPPSGSQHWVASFIQETIDNKMKVTRPDIYQLILNRTSMHLC